MSTPIPSLGNKTPEQLKVAELREELKKRGIHIKGLKKDLVERLDEILRQEAAEADDISKKSSPEEVSNDGEAETPVTPVAAIAAVMEPTEPTEVDDAVPEVELKPGLVEVELGESLPLAEVKPGTVELELSVSLPEEDGLSTQGKEVETDRLQEIVMEPENALKETDTSGDVTAESLREADFQPSTKLDEESRRQETEISPAVDVSVEPKPLEGGAKFESAETSGEKLDSGELVKAGVIITSDNVKGEEPNVDKPPEGELSNQAEQLKPVRYLGTASSTDAVIIDALEAEDLAAENAVVTEGMQTVAYEDRDMEEREGSVVEETGAEAKEIVTSESITVETVSVITETTVVTTETIVVNEIEEDLSAAQAEHGEGSFTRRISDAGTLSNEGKEKEAVVEQHRDKYEEGMDVEQEAKAKDSKPMEIDCDSLAGVKRKDGDESRHQEPTKRQRRWNSEKSAGAIADGKAPPKVITTDTFKETVVPEVRESILAPVARSPSTTASSTPKASASTGFDRPTPSRAALSRTDIAVNGEADKRRGLVPPPVRTPTISLKIDRFVRPFTIKAVKELLEQTGTVKEMWMDQIKTHCYVTYSSVEEAIATRNALYHLQWPVAGGRLLVAEFVEPEDVKSRVDGVTDKPAATPVTTPRGSTNSSAQVAGSAGLTSPGVSIPTSGLPPPPPLPPPPRERPALPAKKEQEPPIPTLDDLFKKTRTKPQIYFLPLTEEQVADKLRNKQPVSKPPLKA